MEDYDEINPGRAARHRVAVANSRYSSYKDTFQMLFTMGSVVKIAGFIVGFLVLVGIMAKDRDGLLLGAILGVLATFIFWCAGLAVQARARTSVLTLETAINTSPALSDEDKHSILLSIG